MGESWACYLALMALAIISTKVFKGDTNSWESSIVVPHLATSMGL